MANLKLDKSKIYAIVLLLAMAIVGYFRNNNQEKSLQASTNYNMVTIKGNTMGTYYDIRYLDSISYQTEIDSVLENFNQLFSTYIPNSTISRWNNNDWDDTLPRELLTVIKRSRTIASLTDSMFDPFAAPVFELWGKHKKRKTTPSTIEIDSVLKFSGISFITIEEDSILKKDPRVEVNLNAIAKGHGCDVIGQFLESKGVNNYKVEIGGEISCKGSKDGQLWRISIESPTTKGLGEKSYTVIELSNVGMATSGNYRNYYTSEDGSIYAHTMNPKMGEPVKNKLLSVTVIAPDCMTADAYATAFMALGKDKSQNIVEKTNDLEALFIYSDGKDMKSFTTAGFEKLIMKGNE